MGLETVSGRTVTGDVQDVDAGTFDPRFGEAVVEEATRLTHEGSPEPDLVHSGVSSEDGEDAGTRIVDLVLNQHESNASVE